MGPGGCGSHRKSRPYTFIREVKCVLSYTGTQHSVSPALVSSLFGKCHKWKHIREDHLSEVWPSEWNYHLYSLKWCYLKQVLEKYLLFIRKQKKKNSLLSLPFSLLQPDIKGCLNDLISKPKVYKVKTIKLWYYYFRPSGSFWNYLFPRSMADQSEFLLYKRDRKIVF